MSGACMVNLRSSRPTYAHMRICAHAHLYTHAQGGPDSADNNDEGDNVDGDKVDHKDEAEEEEEEEGDGMEDNEGDAMPEEAQV